MPKKNMFPSGMKWNIEFEKIRIGEKLILETSFDVKYNPDAKIAPLLLIVFIENAFKHAKNTTEQNIFIDIVVKTWGNSILFSVRNSSDSVKHESSILNRHSGFGLENVVRRLDLLYGNAYDLKIDNSDGLYTVMLQVKAK
jgi:LytS/YehU family sensor histidine kinase